MNTCVSPSSLYQSWQALRLQQPRLRIRDAAARLGVSEAELVASRLGVDAWRLNPDWSGVLRALENLGRVMVLTRNEHCVHERKGYYRDLVINGNGQIGLVVSPDIDLRLFLAGWHSLFAVMEQNERGTLRSLQVFDKTGQAVHKVYLTETSDLSVWDSLLEQFLMDGQPAGLDLKPAVGKESERPDAEVDQSALREHWASLKDTHHFHAMLRKHQVARTQALRLAGTEWAEPLDLSDLPRTFERAAESQLPIMVFVGNPHCIQIHTGKVEKLRWLDTWFNVLDDDFNLHLQTAGVKALWRVRKPTSDGMVTSLEAFDEDGELILQLFGARKPGEAELTDWSHLAESFSSLPACQGARS